LLNFVRKLIQVAVQSVEEVLLGVVRSEVPGRRRGCVLRQTFECRKMILHVGRRALLILIGQQASQRLWRLQPR
jgi:hypothetical protein